MDFADIRRLAIVAMFSDDTLFEQLALKGGNALNLVHHLGARSSLDVDFSLDKDFQDVDDSKMRIFRALRNRFAEARLTVFDEKFEIKPAPEIGGNQKWGGYQIEFKLIDTRSYEDIREDMARVRRESMIVGPSDYRIFRIQISKYEYCQGKVRTELDDYFIYVYTPAMIAIEKLRAICQQMPEYALRRYPVPRARDFYDIHAVVSEAGVNLGAAESLELTRNIFAAKDVELTLLPQLGAHREFHRQDWPSVEHTVGRHLESFDFYFNFVLEQVKLLKTLWNE